MKSCLNEDSFCWLFKSSTPKYSQSNYLSERKKESEITQSCPTLCDPVDGSLPGSSINGILQARILEWVSISISRGSSQPRDWTHVSCIGRRFFEAPGKTQTFLKYLFIPKYLLIWIFLHFFGLVLKRNNLTLILLKAPPKWFLKLWLTLHFLSSLYIYI